MMSTPQAQDPAWRCADTAMPRPCPHPGVSFTQEGRRGTPVRGEPTPHGGGLTPPVVRRPLGLPRACHRMAWGYHVWTPGTRPGGRARRGAHRGPQARGPSQPRPVWSTARARGWVGCGAIPSVLGAGTCLGDRHRVPFSGHRWRGPLRLPRPARHTGTNAPGKPPVPGRAFTAAPAPGERMLLMQ